VNSTPPLSSYNCFTCLEVDTLIEPRICVANSIEAMQTPSHPPNSNRHSRLPAWEHRLPVKYVVAASPGPMSLAVDVEIESTDTAVRRCTQALIDYGATGCFIDIEWAKLNNIPTRPLTNPIPVYNVDGTGNDAGMITDITNVVLRYDNHSERTQLAVTRLGKQSMILGYNWLRNHNPEINWQTKEVKMSRCPHQCSTCRLEDKREAKRQKSMTQQINACQAGAFPR
jgi:hypothetical protein